MKIAAVTERTERPYRISRNCGMVAIPDFRYRGRNTNAKMTRDIPATTSQHITDNPSLNESPFKPTSCSVERFVSNSDPAMKTPVKLRPAKK